MICVGDGAGLLCLLHVLSPDSIRLLNGMWDRMSIHTLLLRSLRHELTTSELFHLHILQGSQGLWQTQQSTHKRRQLWQRQRSIRKCQSCKTRVQHLHWQKFKWFGVAVKYKMKFVWLTQLLHESQGIRLKLMSGVERTFKFFLKCLY